MMKILSGLLQPTDGEIYVRGKRVRFRHPSDALKMGIGMVHQHFVLVPTFTPVENVLLTEEGDGGIMRSLSPLKYGEVRERLERLMKETGLSAPLDTPVELLPVGVRQRVEILKVLYRGTDVLILDEPTSYLSPIEVVELFKVLRRLKEAGKSIVFIILGESFGAFLITAGAVWLLTRDPAIALIFGALAPASAPAGTMAVIHELRARGPMTDALIAVVGFDDGLAVPLFVLSLAGAGVLSGGDVSLHDTLIEPAVEIFGAILSGVGLGLLGALVAKRSSCGAIRVPASQASAISGCTCRAGRSGSCSPGPWSTLPMGRLPWRLPQPAPRSASRRPSSPALLILREDLLGKVGRAGERLRESLSHSARPRSGSFLST